MIPIRAVLGGGLAAALVCAAVACEKGLFAPRGPLGGSARLAIAANVVAAGGTAAAFDRADAVRVRLTRAGRTALDTTMAFKAADETRVAVVVPLEVSVDTAGFEVELRSAGTAIFSSRGSATLKRGQTSSVTIELTPVASALLLPSTMPAFTSLGDTAWARCVLLFSTGDTIRGAYPTWRSLNPAVVTAGPDSMLVARAEGVALIEATYGGLVQTMSVTVSAVVASVTVNPRNVTALLRSTVPRFSAVARDRRGNPLDRAATWSSSNPSVASVDATGLATTLAAGTSIIVAAVGSVRDSTQLTVTAGQPPLLSGGSAALLQLVEPSCVDPGTGLTASSYRVSFDYGDVDGDVPLSVTAVGGTWGGYPSGNGGAIGQSALRSPSFTGTGFSGQVQFTLCYIFRTDLYVEVSMTLTDRAGNMGQLNPIRITKPVGATGYPNSLSRQPGTALIVDRPGA